MQFYSQKLSQNKAFARSLKRWLQGRQFTDSQVAVFISSSLTHLFIEIDLGHSELYQQYSVLRQTQKLSEFVEGFLTQDDLKQFYQRIVGSEFDTPSVSA